MQKIIQWKFFPNMALVRGAPKAGQRYMRSEIERWGKVVREVGIRVK